MHRMECGGLCYGTCDMMCNKYDAVLCCSTVQRNDMLSVLCCDVICCIAICCEVSYAAGRVICCATSTMLCYAVLLCSVMINMLSVLCCTVATYLEHVSLPRHRVRDDTRRPRVPAHRDGRQSHRRPALVAQLASSPRLSVHRPTLLARSVAHNRRRVVPLLQQRGPWAA